MDEYVKRQERKGFEKLEKLNQDVFHFDNLGRTPDLTSYDASATTVTNRIIHFEVKDRGEYMMLDENFNFITNKGYSGSTLYIEEDKFMKLLMDNIHENTIPVYIQFLNDTAIVFNLDIENRKRFKKPIRKSGIKAKNPVKGEKDTTPKWLLEISDASIFMLDKQNNSYKLLRKGGE